MTTNNGCQESGTGVECLRGHIFVRFVPSWPPYYKECRKAGKRHFVVSCIPGFIISYYMEVIAKVCNLPFDKLRMNGLRLKSLNFSVRGELVEPQKNTFAIGSMD